MDTPKTIEARVAAIDDRTDTVRIITLAPTIPLPFKAGQFIHVSTAEHEPRAFSIANAPTSDGHIRLHVRNTGQGLSAHMADVNIGDILHLEGPYGTMDAEHARNRPVLLIAGGTGVAPMLSLLQEILRRGLTESGIIMVYGARTHTDLYCRPELEVFLATGELTLHEAVGEDTPDRVVSRLEEDLSKHVVYISGPPPMVNSVREILHMHRVDPANIHADSWTKDKP